MLSTREKQYPEEYDGSLDCGGNAHSCAFNRFGTLLAVGCRDGKIILWDLQTRGISRTFTSHSYCVTTLCWSRNGKYLASGAYDGTLYVWDVVAGERQCHYCFVAPLVKAQFHPRCNKEILVCVSKHAPSVVDIEKETCRPIPDQGENVTAAYNRKGSLIVTGNSRGMVSAFETDSLKELLSVRVTTSLAQTQIKAIEFCSKRSVFLVSSSDRVIRLFDSDTLPGGPNAQDEPACVQRMQDLVNRTIWKTCHFSSDSSYVVAACSREHFLHIYETSTGTLVTILKGQTGEDVTDVAWHPLRPMIISVCNGSVFVWSHNPVENWSAFAPNFCELEENEEYDERESEFDQEDEDRSEQGDCGDQIGDDLEVDVECVDEPPPYFTSDEEDDSLNLLGLPVRPEMDEEEEKEWRTLHPNEPVKRKNDSTSGDDELPNKRLKVVEVSPDGRIASESPSLAQVPNLPRSRAASSTSSVRPPLTSNNHFGGAVGDMLPDLGAAAAAASLPPGDLNSIFSELLDSNGSAFSSITQGPLPVAADLNLDDFVP